MKPPTTIGAAMVQCSHPHPIYQLGVPAEHGDKLVRDPTVPNLPTLGQLYKMIYGKEPSGIAYTTYLALTMPYTIAQRVLALAPGSPKAAVEALRKGAIDMRNDPAFQKDMMRVIRYKLPVYPGTRAAKAVRDALGVSPKVKSFLKSFMNSGKQMSRD